MKKVYILTLALAAIACDKNVAPSQDPQPEAAKKDLPAWVYDESALVPIEFGGGSIVTDTKGSVLTEDAFKGAKFTVFAAKTTSQPGASDFVMPGFTGGVLAQNGTTEVVASSGKYAATFVGGDKYYPFMASAGAFSFYAYRVDDNTTVPALSISATNGCTVDNIAIGQQDIIWADAVAWTDLTQAQKDKLETDQGEGKPKPVSAGFNAKYIRKARYEATDDAEFKTAYLPQLDFKHKTAQLKFKIKAYDSTAETSFDSTHGNLKVTGLSVGTVPTTASLNVLTGALTGGSTVGAIPVTVESAIYPVEAGTEFGEPIFILPTADELTLTLSVTVGGVAMTPNVTTPISYTGGFEAGKAYSFTVTLQSLEKIEVVTSLEEWAPVNAGEIVIE